MYGFQTIWIHGYTKTSADAESYPEPTGNQLPEEDQ